MYHPHHFLSQIKQMNQRTSVPAKKSHDPNRYQAYYGLYGADDPKTKAAEADMK